MTVEVAFGQLQLLSIDIFILICCPKWLLPIRNAWYGDINYGSPCSICLNMLNTENMQEKVHMLPTHFMKSNWKVIDDYNSLQLHTITIDPKSEAHYISFSA